MENTYEQITLFFLSHLYTLKMIVSFSNYIQTLRKYRYYIKIYNKLKRISNIG